MNHLTISDINTTMCCCCYNITRLWVAYPCPSHKCKSCTKTCIASCQTVAYESWTVKTARSVCTPFIRFSKLAVCSAYDRATICIRSACCIAACIITWRLYCTTACIITWWSRCITCVIFVARCIVACCRIMSVRWSTVISCRCLLLLLPLSPLLPLLPLLLLPESLNQDLQLLLIWK